MKIALVHDFLNQLGGAERVLKSLHNLFPQAPVFTLLYNPEKTKNRFRGWQINTSFLEKSPNFLKNRPRYLLALMPPAIESFNFSDYDLVISDSNSFAKGIIVPSGTKHICYCHSPTRYLWDWYHQYLLENKLGGLGGFLARIILHFLRLWDRAAADRVDFFIANSQTTQERIKKYYGCESTVIYPPVETKKFRISRQPADYYLIVSRLSSYKNIALAVEALAKLKAPLLIIGEGNQKKALAKLIRARRAQNIKLLGWQNDQKMIKYYSDCRALIFPGEEDFGIVPVEAMASGRPVIALGKGGATESVIDGKTGILFPEPTGQSLIQAIKKFETLEKKFNPLLIQKRAREFDEQIFKIKMRKFIRENTRI